MAVIVAYLVFLPIAAIVFARFEVRRAILIVAIGGWLLLPVGRYHQLAGGGGFPWWITGTALPCDMLLTKAWIAPAVALAGAALRDSATLRAWRPSAIDAPMAAWIVWPLLGLFRHGDDPAPLVAALYVAGVWGLPWLLGRIWFAGRADRRAIVSALAFSGLANAPVAIAEGVRPAFLYPLVYGYHPFLTDGVERYVGYRPVGFLEHGNLYGLWTALAAFAAIWLARAARRDDRRCWIALAAADAAMALAAQSAGAILLLALGLGLLFTWRARRFAAAIATLAGLVLLAALVHLSGVVPLETLAHTTAGRHAIGAMRAIGRGSLLWRFSQDSKTLATIAAHPLVGSGRWDWWRIYGTRPWGQAVLLIGQYGLIGLAAAWGALLVAAARPVATLRRARALIGDEPGIALAIITLLALLDAMLNAFFFLPAILAAGAIGDTLAIPASTRPGGDPARKPRPNRHGQVRAPD